MKKIASILAAGVTVTAAAQTVKPVVSYLEIFDVESGTHRIIKEFPYTIEAPNWTPDGKWLVYNAHGKLFKIAVDGSGEPEMISTGSIGQLNNDHVISADGKWIGFSANGAKQGYNSFVYTVPFEGGEPKQITPVGPSYLHGISPDGKFLAFCGFRPVAKDADVYVTDLRGREKRLTDAPGLDDGPEYSLDGKYIWFNSVRTGRMQAWRMKPDGKQQTQMTFDTDMNSWFPHISPDGTKVVYIAYHDYEIAPGDHLANLNVQLRMIPAKGGEPVILTELFGGQGTINVNSWSPDSRQFAYVSYRLKEELEAPHKEMAVQMYSVRQLLGTPELYAKNHVYVLERLRQMGYSAVELASYEAGRFSGMEPAAFAGTIKDAGLKISSSHTTRVLSPQEMGTADFGKALEWWDECIAAHKEAGIDTLIMSYYPQLKTMDQVKTLCSYVNAIAERCCAAGIRFGYHNHNQEFAKIGDTTMLDYLLANTDPGKTFFELDVYWTVVGGASPVDYFRKYPGRFPIVHIKDQRELGQSGMVGFDAIFGNFGIAGTRSYVVEMEYSSSPNVLQGLMDCAQYIRNASFVKETYK